MHNKLTTVIMLFCGLFLFVLDRVLKWQALHAWNVKSLWGNSFGWHPFFNIGVAFGLPVPGFIIIVLTLIILLIIAHHLFFAAAKDYQNHSLRYVGFWLIFLGAVSNLLDRIFYGSTVDYFLIATAVINFADILIVAGFIMYLISVAKDRAKA